MAESEEQELILETEAAQDDGETDQQNPEEGDEGGVEEPPPDAAAAEEGQEAQEDQEPPEEVTEEVTEQPEEQPEEPTEEMAEVSQEEPTPAAADIDEPAELEPAAETEPTTDIEALEKDLTEFRHCIESIGTQLDDEMNRQDMRKLRAAIREKATRMELDLKERQKTKDQMEPQERIYLQQVIKQLETQLNTYHELLERERSMTRQYPLAEVGDDVGQRPVDHAATPSQAQTMLTGNLKEREHEHVELMELERDILGLQDIQTDLATLIGEQADDVRLIEQNVERAGDRVEHGHSQMQQSVGLSKGRRKISCVILTILACIVTFVIILAAIVVVAVLSQR